MRKLYLTTGQSVAGLGVYIYPVENDLHNFE